MDLSDTVKNNIVVIVASAFAAGAGLSWTVVEEIKIEPMREEIGRLEKSGEAPKGHDIKGSSEARVVEDLSNRLKLCESRLTSLAAGGGITAGPAPKEKAAGYVEEVEGFTFTLQECTLEGDELDCDLSVTPDRDRLLTFWGSSRLVENDGTELLSSKIALGEAESRRGRYSSLQKDLVRGVPMKMGIAFAGVKPGSDRVTLIELVCSGFRVQFRDVVVK